MQNGGQRNRQGGDVGQCIEVCRACAVAHPQPFLTCGFEAGIVTLTLRPQGVSLLEIETAAVNGKSVIVWNGLVSRADGRGSRISAGYAHCRSSCHPCA